jgi:hypothetical protein
LNFKPNDCKSFQNVLIKLGELLFLFVRTLLLVVFWPLVMTWKRFWSEIQFATVYGKEKFELQMERRDHTILSSRARMIEVCIESSFQPLLQLYLLLPKLISYVECESYKELLEKPILETFSTESVLQFWSVITSVLALAWSFNFYKITQKSGALEFNANPIGRVCLWLSTLLQISCRLLAAVLFAYCFGPGNFYPMIIGVQCHILLMAVLHYFTSQKIEMDYNAIPWKRLLHHCLLNGIGNIYIHNCITYMDDKAIKDRKKKIHKESKGEIKIRTTFWRQILFNAIFFLENIAVVSWASSQLQDQVPVSLLLFVPLGHIIGLAFHVIYYQYFHLWKDLLYMHVDLCES